MTTKQHTVSCVVAWLSSVRLSLLPSILLLWGISRRVALHHSHRLRE